MRIACIVEGHGDEASVPVLVRRIANETGRFDVEVTAILRISRSRIVRPGELERAVELAGRRLASAGIVIAILDADDDPPCRFGPELLARMRKARSDLHSILVLANREFEAWFLGALESLRGRRGVHADAVAPEDADEIRGAKERLQRSMSRPYSEITDQPAFAAMFDMTLAERRSRSFRKLRNDLSSLLRLP